MPTLSRIVHADATSAETACDIGPLISTNTRIAAPVYWWTDVEKLEVPVGVGMTASSFAVLPRGIGYARISFGRQRVRNMKRVQTCCGDLVPEVINARGTDVCASTCRTIFDVLGRWAESDGETRGIIIAANISPWISVSVFCKDLQLIHARWHRYRTDGNWLAVGY